MPYSDDVSDEDLAGRPAAAPVGLPGRRPRGPLPDAPPPPPPPPPAPAAPAGLPNWGHVGTATERRTSSGTLGVRLVVDPDIGYTVPPPLAGRAPTWTGVPGEKQTWQMEVDFDPAAVRTLWQVGAELRDAGPDAPAPLRDELDAAAAALLGLAAALHAGGRGVGLLTPENVLLVPESGGSDLILPDIGFHWDGDQQGNAGFPFWLQGRRPYYELADPGDDARRRQLHPLGQGGPAAVADVRLLARLFAAVLTGKPRNRVAVPTPAHACWEALAQADRGELKTAAELADALRDYPLSHHFTPAPAPAAVAPARDPDAPPPRRPFPWLPLLAGAGALAAVAGGLIYLGRPSRGPDTAATDPDTVGSGEGSGKKTGKITGTPTNPLGAAAASPPSPAVIDWEKRYEAFIRSDAARAGNRTECDPLIQQLEADLTRLRDAAPAADRAAVQERLDRFVNQTRPLRLPN